MFSYNNIISIIHEASHNQIRDRANADNRIDFMQYFRDQGRSWLREDIERESEALIDFIDRSLTLDPAQRWGGLINPLEENNAE